MFFPPRLLHSSFIRTLVIYPSLDNFFNHHLPSNISALTFYVRCPTGQQQVHTMINCTERTDSNYTFAVSPCTRTKWYQNQQLSRPENRLWFCTLYSSALLKLFLGHSAAWYLFEVAFKQFFPLPLLWTEVSFKCLKVALVYDDYL